MSLFGQQHFFHFFPPSLPPSFRTSDKYSSER